MCARGMRCLKICRAKNSAIGDDLDELDAEKVIRRISTIHISALTIWEPPF